MEDQNTVSLQEELLQYQKEKEKIRNVIGRIGGAASAKRDRVINICFIIFIVILFLMDTMRHLLGMDIPLPPLFSVEIGLLLVSVKIIWMIHKQGKIEHFQFWILSSIEYRVNDMTKKMQHIERSLKKIEESKKD
ncbi:MAG: hypothetical protein KAI43_05960 [Candidatus Aureabacteria bacterium]|nr:hypothetical protein [Candidatus Auribacterota bacterium]